MRRLPGWTTWVILACAVIARAEELPSLEGDALLPPPQLGAEADALPPPPPASLGGEEGAPPPPAEEQLAEELSPPPPPTAEELSPPPPPTAEEMLAPPAETTAEAEALPPSLGEGTAADPAFELAPPLEPPPGEETLGAGSDSPLDRDGRPRRRPRGRGWLSQEEKRRWPGAYIGGRLGFSFGNALVPRYGDGEDRTARVAISQTAPYLGIELGYTRRRWGFGLTFEGTFLTPKPDFLQDAPTHLLVGLQANYVRNESWRWVFGVDPFTYYRMAHPSGIVMTLGGVGGRAGAHYRFTDTDPDVAPGSFEGFGYLYFSRFTVAEAGFRGNTRSYPPFDFVGVDKTTSLVMLMLGVQFSLAR